MREKVLRPLQTCAARPECLGPAWVVFASGGGSPYTTKQLVHITHRGRRSFMSANSCRKCDGTGQCPACAGTGTLVFNAPRDAGVSPPGQGTLISRCGTCKGV